MAWRSSSASANYGVSCEKCGAGPNDPCRTKSGRVTDTHRARIDLAYMYRADRMRGSDR